MSEAVELFKETLEFGGYKDYAAAKRSIAGMRLTPEERVEATHLAQKAFGVKDEGPVEVKKPRAKKTAAPVEPKAKSNVLEDAAKVAQKAVAVSTKLPPAEARKVAAEGSRTFHVAMERLSQSPVGFAAIRRLEQ